MLIIASPISLDDIPLDNSVEMTVTRKWESTWYKPGDVITIGTQGKVSKEYYISHFRRCADTMDFDGNVLLEYTYLFGHFGIPSCMKKDIAKLKSKLQK